MSKTTRGRGSRSSGRSGRGRTYIGRSGGRHGTAANAVETFTRPNQTLPVILALVVWRWRWELICLITVVFVWNELHDAGLNDYTTTAAMLGVCGAFAAFGPTRRFWRNRFWCVVTRHRVRACLSEMRTLNYSGNLPFIIFCRSTKVGESVWLWMRPGLSETDLENRAETLAAACWAREARIERNRKNAALIRIDIDRRDPLAKAHITSPLVDDTADLPNGEVTHDAVLTFIGTNDTGRASTTAPTDQSGDNEPDLTDLAVHQPTRKVKKPKPTAHADTAQTAQPADPVVLFNGEDVSDYV